MSDNSSVKPGVRPVLEAKEYVEQVRAGNRVALARAITLIESSNAAHRKTAQTVLQSILPHTGKSLRIGISGVPGVGKSTFIEALGSHLTNTGHKLAVLAVDPSSTRTGGSILGDKTRMQKLSTDPNAYIRPSPASGTLGGVTRVTRETILLCEAAGFDTIIVETVGVGQSEIAIASMVDFYLLLMLPGAGDELQGIKKGVLEIADMIAINKADGKDDLQAQQAAAAYRNALHILTPVTPDWDPPVVTCSALHEIGIENIWQQVVNYQKRMQHNGEWQKKRDRQQTDWMWSLIEHRLLARLHEDPVLKQKLLLLEADIKAGRTTPVNACEEIIRVMGAT